MIIMRLGIVDLISFIFWNSFWKMSAYSFWRLYNLIWMSEIWTIWEIVSFVCLIMISALALFGGNKTTSASTSSIIESLFFKKWLWKNSKKFWNSFFFSADILGLTIVFPIIDIYFSSFVIISFATSINVLFLYLSNENL